jgi:hypothetical protein
MKQILIIIAALVLIISFNFVQSSFLTKASEILTAKIERLEESIIDIDSAKEEIKKYEQELQTLWNKKEFGLDIFCEHNRVDEIKENISNIHRYVVLLDEQESNYKDIKLQLIVELNILKQRVKEVVNNEKLKLTNVL